MDSSDSRNYDTQVRNGAQGVTGRVFKLCDSLKDVPVSTLWRKCEICAAFVALCCTDLEKFVTAEPCHHYHLCFTDGACLNNGQSGSVAGIGIALGANEEDMWAFPIDDDIDPDGKRSSQRAELLAAIEGLRRMSEHDYDHAVTHGPHPGQEGNPDSCWIVATDSEYVCKGITEWIYNWQANKWLTRSGTKPSNLDLFLRLHLDITSYERDRNIRVGFWKIDRNYNQLADYLAKEAAKLAGQASYL